MIELRISKFNPKYRNNEGAYQKDTWTSISDIGKVFEGEKLSLADYLDMENKYLKALNFFLECNNIHSINVIGGEIYEQQIEYIPLELKNDCMLYLNGLKGKREILKDDTLKIILLALREMLWCKLEHESGFYIHFGYDYYVYSCLIDDNKLLPNIPGIYIEEFNSPYKGNFE